MSDIIPNQHFRFLAERRAAEREQAKMNQEQLKNIALTKAVNDEFNSYTQHKDPERFTQKMRTLGILYGNDKLQNFEVPQYMTDVFSVNEKTREVKNIGKALKGSQFVKVGEQTEWKPQTKEEMLELERAKAGLKPPTQNQETSALYAGRIEQANKIFDSLEGYINNLPVVGTYLSGKAPNWAKDPRYQSYEQAQRNFVNAVLRRESGAVISPSEFEEARKQYFPQPGDSAQVIAQKKENRRLVQEYFMQAGGNAYKAMPEMGIAGKRVEVRPGTPEVSMSSIQEGATATNPATGQKIIFRGGAWQTIK